MHHPLNDPQSLRIDQADLAAEDCDGHLLLTDAGCLKVKLSALAGAEMTALDA